MITPEFKEEYEKLNPEQKRAVDAIEGPVMVVAGPGTGKTTILTLRIANILLKTDTPPSGILALTFTEAGVKSMRMKLRRIMGSTADEVRIHTFHGFAASVIKEFEDHFPHLSKTRQLGDVEAESLIREILKQAKFKALRPFGEPDFYVPKILGAISESKREAWIPEMLRENAKAEIEKIKADPEAISSRGATKGKLKAESLKRIEKCERTILLSAVYEIYEQRKKAERLMDYDDLIFELLKALREDELLLRLLQEKFLYILVDEHQDTNESQNLIISLIASFFESPNLFIVGDEKQAIYRFQGASFSNFMSLQKMWQGMEVIKLKQNYRSHQDILDAAFNMIEENYAEGEHADLRVKLSAGAKRAAKPLDVALAQNEEAEELFIAQNASKILEDDPEAEIAVIVRRNREVEQMLAIFEQSGIPAKAERGADIFAHPIGILFFSLIQFLIDPSRTESLAKTIASGLWDIPFEAQVDLIKRIRRGDLDNLEAEMPNIAKLRSLILTYSPIAFLSLASDLSGLTKLIKTDQISAEIWRGIINLAGSIIMQESIEDPESLIKSLLEYRDTAEHKSIKIISGNPEAKVTIMTAHSSKGLEFDYVFIPQATEEVWIGRRKGSFFVLPEQEGEGDDVKDERRLFYVAITRAKSHVFISAPIEDASGKPLTPLRFIDELGEKHVNRIELERYDKPIRERTSQDIENQEIKRKADLAKSVLATEGLSFTTLNNFIISPEYFFERCILKVPEPPSPNSERGIAMHEAVSKIWKEVRSLRRADKKPEIDKKTNKNISEQRIEEIILESVNEYFHRSFLAKYEREILLEELRESAKAVAECLLPHFAIPGEISTEIWAETVFEFRPNPPDPLYTKGGVEINLHGRLDAVIEQNGKLLVFDYKTKEGMSERAIRGETQNTDGSYFRQLIFYKILLSENPRLQEKIKSKDIELSLVFIRPDEKGRCPTITIQVTDADIARVKSEISALVESVWSGGFLKKD